MAPVARHTKEKNLAQVCIIFPESGFGSLALCLGLVLVVHHWQSNGAGNGHFKISLGNSFMH